jgi:hypothetical protein
MKVSALFKKKKDKKKKCKGVTCVCSKSVLDRVAEFEPFLKELQNSSPDKRISLIKRAPSCLIRFLCECGLNILRGNLKLSDQQYEELKPHKTSLLKFSKAFSTQKERRQALLKKKGGALPVLIPIVLSALASFAGEAIARAVGV